MTDKAFNAQIIDAFLCFSHRIMSGKEGAFFIMNRAEIEQTPSWAFGCEGKKLVKFDDPIYPKFCTSNFLGDKNYSYTFEDTFTSLDAPFEPYRALSDTAKKLEVISKLSLKHDLSFYASETESSFIEKVENIQRFEKDGNAWVVNMTQNILGDLEMGAQADSGGISKQTKSEKRIANSLFLLSSFYHFLKSGSSVCGGLVVTGEQLFCSFSPEVFIKQDDNKISTFPVKGTGRKDELQDSEKEISELNMVTDLLRNDFGQICDHVEVRQERYLTKEKDFYHAQSEIVGVLDRGMSERRSDIDAPPLLDWKKFKSLLPAGSISGAPKKNVLEKILELENFDRRFYTGTFGVQFSPEKSIYNILIRTLFLGEKHWYFPVGAGITVESDPVAEFSETFQKAKVFERFCVE